jgi:predicted kinase
MKKLNFTLIAQQLTELAKYNPLMIVLIGAPGSGKSTFIKRLSESLKLVIGSTDNQIDAYAAERGLNYSEAFKEINFKMLKRQMEADILGAVSKGEHVIVDQTNMHRKSRKDKLAMATSSYVKVAIVFEVAEKALFERLAKREAEIGKHIPHVAVYSMLKNYEAPSRDEGFDHCLELEQDSNFRPL